MKKPIPEKDPRKLRETRKKEVKKAKQTNM